MIPKFFKCIIIKHVHGSVAVDYLSELAARMTGNGTVYSGSNSSFLVIV